MTLFQFKSFKTRLIFWLLLISILPLISLEISSYHQRIDEAKARALEKLEAVRTLKTRVMETWLQERSSSIRNIAGTRAMEDLEQVLDGRADAALREELLVRGNDLLRNSVRNYLDYDEMLVIDPESGRILLASDPDRVGQSRSNFSYFLEPYRTRTLHMEGIYHSQIRKKPTLTFSAPIFSHDDPSKLVAILVTHIDLENSFYPLLLNRDGLGGSGETLLVNSEGIVLSPLRWEEDATLRMKIEALPARHAAKGDSGVIEARDYRNVQVLAAFGHIDLAGWGIVTKQDLSEVDQVLKKIARQSWMSIIFSALGIILLAVILGRSFSRPIQEMARVARRIEEGETGARNQIARRDELGFLAKSFNAMADSLTKQMKVLQGSAEISRTVTSSRNLGEFGTGVLRQMVRLSGSNLGAFYLLDEEGEAFRPLSSLGVLEEMLTPVSARSLEGDFGHALSRKKISLLSSLPEDSRFVLKTFAGNMLPRQVVTLPLLVDGEVRALVSLASLQGYSEAQLELMEHSWPTLNTALSNLLAHEATERMAAELRESNDELAAANEELQSQSEELQAQAEELQSQSEELRAQAEELETKRQEVEQSDRLKSEFLSNMSHELRTPLNSVMALSQLMIARGTALNPEQDADYLRVIDRNARHLLNLINDILDLSKIEAGRMDIFWSDLNPEYALNEALDTVRPMAEGKGVRLELTTEDLPVMHSDGDKVHQILLNLLSNAVKFTQDGTVRVSVQEEGGQISFRISDTGIGISEEDLTHIFDEFRQVDGSVTRRFEGTGLGLAISRKLARLLGGDIEAQSRLGEGSTFTLSLPVGLSRMLPPPSSEPKPSVSESVRPDERAVLVVDDDAKVRALVRDYLEKEGYRVIEASSGHRALEVARTQALFAITLDVMMPDLDGWEVIRLLKASERTRDIPVIMLTVSEDRETGAALGASGFLNKPVERKLLLREIARLGGQRPVRRLMIVDDSPVDRSHLARLLESAPYEIRMAEGGRQGLERLLEDPPDALLLDLMMEDMDGFTVLEHLRENPRTRELPVLILTAKDLSAEERSRLYASAQRVLAKGGVDRQKLLGELGALLSTLGQQKRPRREAAPLVLVVEDNPVAALQIQNALEDAGLRVNVAPGGAEGLECVARELPDAVVLDLMMPDVDGFEVLEQVRSTPRSATLPVLVLTAKELTAADRARLSHNNVRELVQKGSLDRDQLIARVRSLLEESGAELGKEKGLWTASPAMATVEVSPGEILVVEDNPDNLLTLSAILDDAGYRYATVTDGRQAVDKALATRPKIILMDMQLPVMSGMDATRIIKSEPSLADTHIVALTARAMKGDREEILAAGCDDYLSKPLDPVALVEMLRRWMPGPG